MSAPFVQDPSAPRRLWPWSVQAIGVYLGRSRAVAVEGDRTGIRWMLDGPGADEFGDVQETMADVLRRIPRARGAARPPSIVVALSAEFVQCKRLFGLPPVRDRATASAVVREGAMRFFRRTADDLITSDLEQDSEPDPKAAAFQASAVRAVRDACARAKVRLRAIVPAETLSVLAPELVPETATEAETRFALRAALVAAANRRAEFNALSEPTRVEEHSPARVRAAAIVAAVAILALLIAPPASAHIIAARAARVHATLRQRENSALATSTELAKVSEALDELGKRAAARRSAIDLLAHLAATLPVGSAITQLQLDSTTGTITAMAASADELVKGLSQSPLLRAPAVVGPVTRERVASREVDRFSVRFTHQLKAVEDSTR